MENTNYPSITKRFRAIFLDSLLLIAFMVIIANIFAAFENIPNYVTISILVVVFLLYDPLMVSIFGGTVGHLSNGIRVRKFNNQNQKINFFVALLRFTVKSMLGWLSFIFAYSNKDSRALHDLASESVVVFAP